VLVTVSFSEGMLNLYPLLLLPGLAIGNFLLP